MISRRWSCLCLLFISGQVGWLLAQQAVPSPPPISRQIKKNLFDDLAPGPSASGGLPDSPSPKERQLPGDTVSPGEAAGEDLGSRGERDPLLPLELQMRSVQRRLDQGDTGPETQLLQGRIVEQLEKMRDSLEQQRDQTGPLVNRPVTQSAGSPAATGNPALGGGGSSQNVLVQEPPAHLSPAVQRIWGSLPPEVRAQLRDSVVERFVPKYERMLEQFYRRLGQSPARPR